MALPALQSRSAGSEVVSDPFPEVSTLLMQLSRESTSQRKHGRSMYRSENTRIHTFRGELKLTRSFQVGDNVCRQADSRYKEMYSCLVCAEIKCYSCLFLLVLRMFISFHCMPWRWCTTREHHFCPSSLEIVPSSNLQATKSRLGAVAAHPLRAVGIKTKQSSLCSRET